MATILRFVDPANHSSIRLDLNNQTSGWYVSRGLDLGSKPIEYVYLTQPPYAGVELASAHRAGVATMRIPLLMVRQANAGAMQTLMSNLATELDRATNCIEYRPNGAASSYFYETFRSEIPSIMKGDEIPNPFTLLQAGQPIVLQIPRQPDASGAGTHI